ncbi:MAG: biotin/lipoyl-binding protein [Candidatus Pseudobacter hemicellulosilyticus]|uniref:Biotin/lipoyl-binding protein n=1 Tax=Candidatus Pseudobacter hemicellulosilyticus TaxID=3121375 RepID=A0AAJ5WW40_9BACT|nr:MAG: biotin/lipoyl-binding protein [Pseudobacter sp.]
MKRILFISSGFFSGILLVACQSGNPTQPALPQGKVKFESIAVAPKVAGRIEKLLVQEGMQVKKGDTLAILGVPEIAAKLEQAEGAITSASGQLDLAHHGATRDQLDQVAGQLDAAQAQLEFADQSFRRVENMYRDSLVPAQQYDEVRAKYNAAKAQVKALKARQQELVSGTRPETIRSAKGQLDRAIGARNEVLQADKERYLLAPADMSVESITLKEGELATPGYTLVNGYELNNTYFRFTIGENSINAYKTGDSFTIQVPNTSTSIRAKIVAVKQLPRYADNTSTSPNRQVGEGFYELKLVPLQPAEAKALYNNSTVLLERGPVQP